VTNRRRLLAVLALCAGACSSTPAAKGYLDSGVFIPPTPDTSANDDADQDGPVDDANPAAWAGTWKYISGSEGNLCDGSLAVVATEGFLDITPSASGRLLSVVDDGCHFVFDLAGDVATAEDNQSCNAWAIPTIPSWTLTMQPDGTLLERIGGQVVVGGEICTLSGGGTLARQ
jgi:hypothetical protein